MDPWSELVALAEREHELAREGHWDEVAELSGERLRRSLALGAAPASARPQLERMLRLESQITAVLQSARAFTSQELARTRRGQTAVRGYGASLAPAAHRVNSLS
jgi:flagellar protein FliT